MPLVFKNLLRRKIRTFLTVLGMITGVIIFSSTHTIMSGYQNETIDLVKKYRVDIFVLSKNAQTPFRSQIAQADYTRILKMDCIKQGFPLLAGTLNTKSHPFFPLIGAASISNLDGLVWLYEGKLYSPDKKELILGRLAAKRMGLHARDLITLGGEEFRIAGIFSSGHTIVDGSAAMDIDHVRRIFNWNNNNFVSCAVLRIKQGHDLSDVTRSISETFPHLDAIRAVDLVDKNKVIKIAESLIVILSIFTAGGCCLLIMNTVLMAVTERTKEIGLLMSIGWNRRRIVHMIISEAVLLSLVGAILGNFFVFILLSQLHRVTTAGISWIPGGVSREAVILSTILAFIMGIIGALYPAWVVTRLKPAEALRYE